MFSNNVFDRSLSIFRYEHPTLFRGEYHALYLRLILRLSLKTRGGTSVPDVLSNKFNNFGKRAPGTEYRFDSCFFQFR